MSRLARLNVNRRNDSYNNLDKNLKSSSRPDSGLDLSEDDAQVFNIILFV